MLNGALMHPRTETDSGTLAHVVQQATSTAGSAAFSSWMAMLPCLAVFHGLTAWYEQAETGFRTSAGISCSKMLAKLVSGMHKPDDQTVILPCHAAAFVATLPVRAIPGEHHTVTQCLWRLFSIALYK